MLFVFTTLAFSRNSAICWSLSAGAGAAAGGAVSCGKGRARAGALEHRAIRTIAADRTRMRTILLTRTGPPRTTSTRGRTLVNERVCALESANGAGVGGTVRMVDRRGQMADEGMADV